MAKRTGNLSLYETISLLEAIKVTFKPSSFLVTTFFPKLKFWKTEKAIVDVTRGGRPMAPFVAKRIKGTLVTRDGYTTNELVTPRIAPMVTITGEDLETRLPGDDIYTVKGDDEVIAAYIMEDSQKLDDMITRREEWFAAQVMLGEAFTVDLEDDNGNKIGEFTVDYGFSNKATVDNKWDGANGDPEKDIEEWYEKKIQIKSNSTPNILVLDPFAGQAFINNAKIQKKLDKYASASKLVEPKYMGDGVTYYGIWTKYNIPVYSYSCIYETGEVGEDDNAITAQMLPKGTAILGRASQGTMHYGVVRQKENGKWMKYMERRVPKYSEDDEEEVDTYRLSSRPLPAPDDIDSYVVANVLV